MSVTYIPTSWKNRLVEKPRTYTSTMDGQGRRTDTPAPGTIAEPGTPLNATNMNHIEQGIKDCADALNLLEGSLSGSQEDITELQGRMAQVETILPGKAVTSVLSANVPVSAWTGAAAPYTATVQVSGLLAADEPIIDIAQTGTYATDRTMRSDWALVARAVTGAGQLTLLADAVPNGALPLRIRVFRT